jgi:hypothetical protein
MIKRLQTKDEHQFSQYHQHPERRTERLQEAMPDDIFSPAHLPDEHTVPGTHRQRVYSSEARKIAYSLRDLLLCSCARKYCSANIVRHTFDVHTGVQMLFVSNTSAAARKHAYSEQD